MNPNKLLASSFRNSSKRGKIMKYEFDQSDIERTVKSYLVQRATGYKRDKVVSDFYRWQAEVCTVVTMAPTEVRALDRYEERFYRAPETQQCFQNALNFTLSGVNKGCDTTYVEGYLFGSHGHIFSHVKVVELGVLDAQAYSYQWRNELRIPYYLDLKKMDRRLIGRRRRVVDSRDVVSLPNLY
jgi:hypothetical protein